MNAQPNKKVRRFVLRLAAGVVALLALGGPSPGYVGSCSTDGGPPSAEQFCVDRKVAECIRDRVAARTTQAQYEACTLSVESTCAGVTWSGGCVPSRDRLSACLNALGDGTRVTTPNEMIEECYPENLCGAEGI